MTLLPTTRQAQWKMQLLFPGSMVNDGESFSAERFYQNQLHQSQLIPQHPVTRQSLRQHCRALPALAQSNPEHFRQTLASLVTGLQRLIRLVEGAALLDYHGLVLQLCRLSTLVTEPKSRKQLMLARHLVLFHYHQALLNVQLKGLRREEKHRFKRGFRFIRRYAERLGVTLERQDESGRERLMARLSLSQKLIERPYQLIRKPMGGPIWQEQAILGFSAAVAMAFATAIAFATQQAFGNFSTPFFFSLVLSYIFKDRIKEVGRHQLVDLFHSRFHQHHYRFYQRSHFLVEVKDTFFQRAGKRMAHLSSTVLAKLPTAERNRIAATWYYRRRYRQRPSASETPNLFIENLTLNLSPQLRLLPSRSDTILQYEDKQIRKYRVEQISSLYLAIESRNNQETALSTYRLDVSRQGIHRIQPIAT
ncbi:hypothetical protein [Ferrimonas balearica]|uniref:hypothetical protein n=1 Tax=Ferrimonas balearica TaxID=44012 RepID=UPI001C999DE9|nr:hypothetical protein [Ferrimonas balearica]MBY5921529.1 hypothetical protein [Ferrimonas balearica]MBY5995786.1 hypothetical protein [Ferrimonas balearica]